MNRTYNISYSGNTSKNCIDCYLFGVTLDSNRHFTLAGAEGYRYAFGSMEKDDEISGEGNSYTAEFWQYSPRTGRRWNIDPVVKHHESPYATYANNPIWFSDPDGADTLMMHRSEALKSSNSKSTFYTVTFSIVKNGVEKVIDKKMLMMANTNAQKRMPHTALNNPEYKLTIKSMPSHPDLKPSIHVTAGVFIHPGNFYHSFDGCYGLSKKLTPTTFNTDGVDNLGIENTTNSIQSVVDLYNKFSSDLTGDKFILKTNSTASNSPEKEVSPSFEIGKLPLKTAKEIMSTISTTPTVKLQTDSTDK